MLVWILFALFLAYTGWRLLLGYPSPRRSYRILNPREAAFLDAAAEAMFPPGGAIPLSGREADLPAYADGFLESLPPHLRLQVRAMFLLFEQATLFFPAPGASGHRRFTALGTDQRIAVLEGWSGSRFFLRRLAFTALRAVLAMGYLGHPVVMRYLQLAPLEFPTCVCEADLLYPRIGAHPEGIALGVGDLRPSDGSPLPDDALVHPEYRGQGW